jgi:cold shock CspA family protein
MGKGHETWNKKDREQKKQKAKKQKEERKKERRENSQKGKGLDDMMAYIDENGHISATPPDPRKMKEIKVEDIEIGVPKQRPIDPSELIRKGIVTFFNESKGYGFIRDTQNQQSVFVHVNSCNEPIQEQSRVSFEVEMGPKGANAVNVKLAD